jgi:RND family efflux transporter MFP subunit
MMSSKRSFNILIAVAVIFSVYHLLTRGSKPGPLDLPVSVVERLPQYAEKVQCSGRVTSLGERFLTVQNGGRLEELSVKLGDSVQKDQILAVVDKTANSAGLKAALSSYRLAQKEYARIGSLSRSGSASREELDRALSTLEIKRAELEQAKQRVEDGIVRAPVSGKVSVLIFKVGDKVPDGSRIVAVDEASGVQVACRLPSAVVAKLPTRGEVVWRQLDRADTAAVRADSQLQVADEQRGFVGLEREVRWASSDPALGTMVGERVQLEAVLPAITDAAKISSAAVVNKADGDVIFVRDANGDYHQVKVSVLQRDAEHAIVVGVPSEGEVIVVQTEISKIEALISTKSKGSRGG